MSPKKLMYEGCGSTVAIPVSCACGTKLYSGTSVFPVALIPVKLVDCNEIAH